MKLPFVVLAELGDAEVARYHRHVNSAASGWHRRFTESIWRRHQHPSNARLSGYRSEGDARRRIVHFYDEYGLEGRSFVLRHAYLRLALTLPAGDVDDYRAILAQGLRHGGWRAAGRDHEGALEHHLFRRGDLVARVAHHDAHPEDERRGRPAPRGYQSLDVTVSDASLRLPDGWRERPWRVFFDVGLRPALPRGNPRLAPPEALADHLPAQVELGCGPSIEAGIPHLSTLHRIYGVSRADYGFIFHAREDGLLSLFADPERKYREMTDLYRACLVARPTPFYRALADLWRGGHLVGPVITNNFDCQCADLDLPELSLRRYDWEPYYPTIDYDARARSLLVVGVHADRRLVQMRARARGLRVLFVDPEQYLSPDGTPIPYPVEAPQDEDLFVRATADEAMRRLRAAVPLAP